MWISQVEINIWSRCAKNNVFIGTCIFKRENKSKFIHCNDVDFLQWTKTIQLRSKRHSFALKSVETYLFVEQMSQPPSIQIKKIASLKHTIKLFFLWNTLSVFSAVEYNRMFYVWKLVSYHLKSSTRRVAIRKHYLINKLWTIGVCNIS